MLKLTIFGSSSKGNCYLLENNKTKIMLDCGIKKLQDMLMIWGKWWYGRNMETNRKL